jgi:hypothetical protein
MTIFRVDYKYLMRLKLFFLLLFLFLFSVQILAQKAGYQPGYIVTNSSDTIEGYVKNINQIPYRVMIKIKFKQAYDDSPKNYSPGSILGFKSNNNTYLSMPIKSFDNSKRFVQEIIRGPLSLYLLEVTTVAGEQDNYRYLKKEHKDQLYAIIFINYKKSLSSYLSDNKVISDKILNKEYKKRDLQQIVKDYNQSIIK